MVARARPRQPRRPSILPWNVHWLGPRRHDLPQHVLHNDFDVLALQEVYARVEDFRLPGCVGTYPLRRLRKRELLQAEVPVADLVREPFECCAVRIRLDGGDNTVTSVYIRPSRPWDPSCPRQLARRLGKNFGLCGDVNAHHPAWGGRKTDPRGREVRDILLQLGLVILNTGAVTYFRSGAQATSTAIDLSVATEGCRYAWSPFLDTWGSDHLPILLSPFRGKAPRDREYRVVD
ncbi:hypothetical protein MTO96_003512 [Rhipicephalus appendiculatus]